MPESQQPSEGQKIMEELICAQPGRRVLDVGAGDGKWGRLLRGLAGPVTALEVWRPVIVQNRLASIYQFIIEADAREFKDYDLYDVIILGDVLEHIKRPEALSLIMELKATKCEVFLTVPISPCPQDGKVYGNPYETHLDQWRHEELEALGWELLHRGMNAAGTVEIGTYRLGRKNS